MASKPSSIVGWPIVAPQALGRVVCSLNYADKAERRLRKHPDDTPADDTRDKAKAYAIVSAALRDTQP